MQVKGILLMTFHLYFYADFTNAFTNIIVKLNDIGEENGDYRTEDNIANYQHGRSNKDTSEAISKILKIIKHKINSAGVTTVEIKKCLTIKGGSAKDKVKCVNKLFYKRKYERNEHPYNSLLEIKEIFPRKYENNYGNYDEPGAIDPTKPFDDSERSTLNFSNDYLDVGDLLRRNAKMTEAKQMNKTKKKDLYVFKLLPDKNARRNNVLRRFRDKNKNDDFIKKKILRTISEEDESSASSEESSPEITRQVNKQKPKLPKRFEVIDKSKEYFENINSESDKSDDISDEDNDIPIQRPIELPRKDKSLMYYMQAPSRIMKVRDEGRRRLPHFLPKRYHWNEIDIKNIRNYWFSGPQGKFWGLYKTPY